ncbi:MAG: GDYXXLXY domain-containing protein [Isosphaeraceae bacterium]
MFDPEIDDGPVGPAKAEWKTDTAGRVLGWLRAQERWVLLATVGFQLLVLGGMIAGKAAILRSGDVVLLRVVPVDPRDLFRGDYVILGYEVGQLPPGGIEGLPGPLERSNAESWQGREVFVSLVPEEDGLHYGQGRVSVSRPPPGTPYITGRLAAGGRIGFGIESYFVQEGRGKAYEAAIREHRLSAEVALTSDGRATLRGLRIE